MLGHSILDLEIQTLDACIGYIFFYIFMLSIVRFSVVPLSRISMRYPDQHAVSGSACGIRIGMRDPEQHAVSGSAFRHLNYIVNYVFCKKTSFISIVFMSQDSDHQESALVSSDSGFALSFVLCIWIRFKNLTY